MVDYSMLANLGLPHEAKQRTLNRRLLFMLFLSVCGLQQVYQRELLPLGSNTRISENMEDLTPQRSPANYTKIYEYELSKTVSFTLMQISWETSHGAVQVSDVCHFKNLCVGNYQGNHLSGRQKYWLARPSEELDLAYITDGEVVEAESVFRRCFNAQFTPAPEFSLRPLPHDPKKTKQIKGRSVGSVKADFGAHPISWLNMWSRLVSVAANVPGMLATFGVTREAFFSQIILFEQGFKLNEWTSSMKDAFVAAARESLPGGLDYDETQPTTNWDMSDYRRSLSQQPAYYDHRDFSRGRTGQIATCFERVTVTALSKMDYFRDHIDASRFKKWAFVRADLEPRATIPCAKEKLKTVVLVRNDRPLWNISGMVQIMNSEDLRDIAFAEITPATSFRDQLKIWNEADIVVSVHGSQLTNSLFMAPHAAFIEVFMPYYNNDDLAKLASLARVNHIKLLSNTLVPEKTVKAEHPHKLEAWRSMNRMMHAYPDPVQCFKHKECRGSSRQIGAIVEPSVFRKAISQITRDISMRQECLR